MPMYHTKVTDESIKQALEMYENGATIAECCSWLSVYRGTFRDYLRGQLRIECRTEHLKKYPSGRVSAYGPF